ncbi:hypothetical protein SAMN05421819_0200 [Bryocella elongata]|uniref:ATP-grasp domain-containing protein n=1 Tax=Bryocella elongata TaxID=863522 RepID=A0A1H5SH43_9BACT|nr:ATPase [Bryocella elongata]SEF49936.1 hypothetical protein SAMN05421819_0200 [Bryocella elongata]
MSEQQPGILCISTYEKGQPFLREVARQGVPVDLLTVDKLAHADWPREILAGFHTMHENLSAEDAMRFIARLMKHKAYARIVALDEFDLEAAALAREHLRFPGMGQTRTRNFRDKLAMREAARAGGVNVPEFCSVANHDALWRWMQRVPAPWLLKPRWSASAIGIKKMERAEDVWPVLEGLHDDATNNLMEHFVPGEIYHVEGVTWRGELKFALPHKYGRPPFELMHHGGVFSTRTLERDSEEARGLLEIHAATLKALGMTDGVTHSEFIRAYADGRFYFLESAARVGGAFIADVAEQASGVNPWVEWARLEVANLRGEEYKLPPLHEEYAGSVICLAKQERPDLSAYDAAEIVQRMEKFHHAGLIVRSTDSERVRTLLEDYSSRFVHDFYARMDAPDKVPA